MLSPVSNMVTSQDKSVPRRSFASGWMLGLVAVLFMVLSSQDTVLSSQGTVFSSRVQWRRMIQGSPDWS
ncbi:MAG: hypothetical protein HRU16_03265 [Planctomycetes bacterium]|nr:hypothetical protein [Planctomycetota bacterium]